MKCSKEAMTWKVMSRAKFLIPYHQHLQKTDVQTSEMVAKLATVSVV
jgi:hypothetical protein